MNFDLALCGIVRDQTLRLNISANSKQNAKIFLIIYLGPMCDRLAKQNRGSKISWHCLFNLLLRIPSLLFCKTKSTFENTIDDYTSK
jgi:hypothetical protein